MTTAIADAEKAKIMLMILEKDRLLFSSFLFLHHSVQS